MDWQNALWVAGLAVIFWFMMRGCGGMGGGCGMGARRHKNAGHSTSPGADDRQRDKQHAA